MDHRFEPALLGIILGIWAIALFHSKARRKRKEAIQTPLGPRYKTPLWLSCLGASFYGFTIISFAALVFKLRTAANLLERFAIPMAIFVAIVLFLIQRGGPAGQKPVWDNLLALVSLFLGVIVATLIFGYK